MSFRRWTPSYCRCGTPPESGVARQSNTCLAQVASGHENFRTGGSVRPGRQTHRDPDRRTASATDGDGLAGVAWIELGLVDGMPGRGRASAAPLPLLGALNAPAGRLARTTGITLANLDGRCAGTVRNSGRRPAQCRPQGVAANSARDFSFVSAGSESQMSAGTGAILRMAERQAALVHPLAACGYLTAPRSVVYWPNDDEIDWSEDVLVVCGAAPAPASDHAGGSSPGRRADVVQRLPHAIEVSRRCSGDQVHDLPCPRPAGRSNLLCAC
jgi:hypothetical protein